ncbi:MAG: hypothetical protein VKK04_15670 [Synechococcales bacterium]|nr:hypothetical protein [Synechococcales bacterium]
MQEPSRSTAPPAAPSPALSPATQPASSGSQLKALLPRFHASYPMASLTSELLAIQTGTYVVRACILVGSSLIATGMAAAADIEAAEDRAKVRALELLNYPHEAPSRPSSSTPSASSASSDWLDQATFAHAAPVQLPASGIAGSASLAATVPSPLGAPHPFAPSSDAPPSDRPALISPPMVPSRTNANADLNPSLDAPQRSPIPGLDADPSPPHPTREAVSPEPANSPAAERSPRKPNLHKGKVPPAPSASTIDLSDIIAKTSVELTRLGWTDEQGREHLQEAYGKRSRQQLTDPELLDFLRYLEGQPTPPPLH